MRPVGTTTVDSSVADATFAGQGGEDSDKHSSGAAPAGGVEMVGDRDGAEEYYGGEAEVSSHCCGGLSPTTIVYMSAFVSSLTSVLLGYGELASSPRRRATAVDSCCEEMSCNRCVPPRLPKWGAAQQSEQRGLRPSQPVARSARTRGGAVEPSESPALPRGLV